MQRYHVQNSFTSGLMSDTLVGRYDLDRYKYACSELTNFVPTEQGAIVRRPPLFYGAEAYNTTVEGDEEVDDIRTMELSSMKLTLVKPHGDDFYLYNVGLPVLPTISALYSSPNITSIAEIGDTAYIASDPYAPYNGLVRVQLDTVSRTLVPTDAPLLVDGPLRPVAASTGTITVSAVTPGTEYKLESSANIFGADDVGRRYDVYDASDGEWHSYQVTSYISFSEVRSTVFKIGGHLPNPSTTELFRVGAFSLVSQPDKVAFFQQRLYVIGDREYPYMVYASKINNFEDFSPYNREDGSVNDADGIAFAPAVSSYGRPLWMTSTDRLLIGTTKGIVSFSSSNGGSITPTNVSVSNVYSYAVSDVEPIIIDRDIVAVSGSGKPVLLRYNYEIEGYERTDLSVFASDIMSGGFEIYNMVLHISDVPVIWMAMKSPSEEKLASVTFSKTSDVVAWAVHEIDDSLKLGGVGLANAVNGGNEDTLLVILTHKVNTFYKMFFNFLGSYDIADNAFLTYLDNARIYTNPVTGTIDLSKHGKPVTAVLSITGGYIVVDGIEDGDLSALVDKYGLWSNITYGYRYSSRVSTVMPVIDTAQGDSSIQVKRLVSAFVGLYKTNYLGILNDNGTRYDLPLYDSDDSPTVLPKYTGTVETSVESSDRMGSVPTFVNDTPFASNITHIGYKVVIDG